MKRDITAVVIIWVLSFICHSEDGQHAEGGMYIALANVRPA